ncbi:GntR family transcriptional regulator [Treponema primitia]|uniref:GntR family transcriptional regulator n=1 Tax=Treponema primitia TaxID=88058 RepID=UPI0002554E34|nr:GntR family transcriptional regulator [Treponema primitia]
MIQIHVDNSSETPIYVQIADQISGAINRGSLPPGYQLPTVRQFAIDSGISQGTIKHAYDALEQTKLIKKARGSGTFVNIPKQTRGEGAKAQAMDAIDALLNRMDELAFSHQDTRIFLDLKLREREQTVRFVSVAAVDCCPEALNAMSEQIRGLPHTDISRFLLEDLIKSPVPFDPAADLVVTTPTHYADLAGKMAPGCDPVRLVMTVAVNTAVDLAAIAPDARVGIACASRRFAQLILNACDKFCKLKHPILKTYFNEGDSLARMVKKCDRLILPSNYSLFTSPEEDLILKSCQESHRPINYLYNIERGSLLYLEEQINRIYQANQNKI